MKHNVHIFRIIIQFSVASAVLLISACSSVPEKQENEIPAQHSVENVVKQDVTYAIDVYDPIEGFNRGMYRFNAGFDKYIFLPIVSAYETVMPDIAQDGVSNFFNNIFEITNFTNSVLQLKPKESASTAGRFLINSTLGLAGLIDIATELGIEEHEEDFGQTLGHYGVGNGPYLILPILGPSNLRDTTGLITDAVIFNEIDPLNFDDHSDRELVFHALRAIDARHNVDFRYYDTGSPFEYELIRLLYTEKRSLDIKR
jgi:phospholipid-binding lipoprotein MlaA